MRKQILAIIRTTSHEQEHAVFSAHETKWVRPLSHSVEHEPRLW